MGIPRRWTHAIQRLATQCICPWARVGRARREIYAGRRMRGLEVVVWRLLYTVIMMMHAPRNVGRTVDVCSIRIEIATVRRMKIATLGRHVRAFSAFKRMVERVGVRSLMGAFRARVILTVG